MKVKVHETRSQAHAALDEEGKVETRKQKAENKAKETEHPSSKNKKAKLEDDANANANGKPTSDITVEFGEFCRVMREHLSVDDMRRILESNSQDPAGPDQTVIFRCLDLMFYGPLESCPNGHNQLECTGRDYVCRGAISPWTTCPYTSMESPRKRDPLKIPDGINDDIVKDWAKNREAKQYPHRELTGSGKPLSGMMISLSGRLSRTHQEWRKEIEENGGNLSNSVIRVACLVTSPAERERGGSSKIVEATEQNIPVVSEAWLIESIGIGAPQPLDAYDVVSDLATDGRGIPWDKQDPSDEAIESLTAEIKLYGKRGVYKDSKLQEQGGVIFMKDGVIYNCAFSLCDQSQDLNEYSILQLIMVPENHLYLYYKKGRVGDDPRAEERVEERSNMEDAVEEFVRIFEELTGNDFEPWEREKKFEKKYLKFHPVDMDDGFDVRFGGLGLRQLGAAAVNCKLDPLVANFMKVLCSQEIYKYALMEMGYDSPDLPTGLLSNFHLMRCEKIIVEFSDELRRKSETGEKKDLDTVLLDCSNKWFTLMHSTRPFIIKSYDDLADHVASALETIRDITVASHVIGDMTGLTIDDPLSDRYNKLDCTIAPLDEESEDYKMILKYLETTYEPVKVGDVSYNISVENIFSIESRASPSYNDVKKLPNKVLLWCGTRSSNLLRHLNEGFLPAICHIPVPGYMFGKAIVCSDAAAEAARYGFTAIDRPEGFFLLAVASLGDEVAEISEAPEDTKQWEEKKMGVKGLGRKTTDESEHFVWRDDVKVPCGRLVPSGHDNSPLEFNEFAIYDPKQVSIMFLVAVKYEEKDLEEESVEP